MNIMPIRWKFLEAVYVALQETGIPLLRKSLTDYIPAESGWGGDIGSTYCISQLAYKTGISLQYAIWWFYAGLIFCGSIVTIIGLLAWSKNLQSRICVVCGVAVLAWIAWIIGDEYIALFCAAAFLPLLLFAFESKSSYLISSVLFIIGLIIPYADFIRIHSALLLLCAVLTCVFVYRSSFKTKCAFLSMLVFGYGCGFFAIRSIFTQRNAFLQEQGVHFNGTDHHHTIWHSIYAGLGFITNDKNLYYSDSCPAQKVKEINSTVVYLSQEYNSILKHEVFKELAQGPHFVLRTVFAKLGVLFYYLLLCLLPFLWALYWAPLPGRIRCVYGVALFWGALPGILTIPNVLYVFGFVASAWLYGLHTALYALNKHSFTVYFYKTKRLFEQLFHRVRLMERG